MRKYFKGYYVKCSGGDKTAALIPALHFDGKRYDASLQVITSDNVYIIPFPGIEFANKKWEIRIGKNRFNQKGLFLDIHSKDCRIFGKLSFGRFQKINYNIMGVFRYIPYMQCRHSIISMNHAVTGKLNINGEIYNFDNAHGYIEGDSGYSFPKEYIWTQCHFRNGSLMMAVADIPLLGLNFKGIIGVILINGREYRIATYLGASVCSLGENEVLIRQGKYTFYAKLIQEHKQGLNAPINGKMIRTIHESLCCKAYYRFCDQDRVLLEFVSTDASFEYEIH